MDSIKPMVLRIIKIAAGCTLILSAAVYLLTDSPMPLIRGLVLGSALGALNFYDLALTLSRASAMVPAKAKGFATRKYAVRYLFMGAALLISIRADYIHVVGTIAGLLLIKFIIMATNLLNDRSFFINIFKRKEDE